MGHEVCMMEFEKQCLVEEGDLQSYWFASDPGLWWGTSHNSCDVCDPNYRRVLVRNTDSILGMISSCRRAERQLDFFFSSKDLQARLFLTCIYILPRILSIQSL